MTKNEMVGWHHRLNGHQFEQTLGYGEGQGSLVYCSLWGHKELGTTEQLNNNRKKQLMEAETSVIQREALVPRSDTSHMLWSNFFKLQSPCL